MEKRYINSLLLLNNQGCVNWATLGWMSKKVWFSYLLQQNVHFWAFYC